MKKVQAVKECAAVSTEKSSIVIQRVLSEIKPEIAGILPSTNSFKQYISRQRKATLKEPEDLDFDIPDGQRA